MDLHAKIEEFLLGSGLTYEILPCDPEMADTAIFCAHYGYAAEISANAILVKSKTGEAKFALCVVLANTRLDVNKVVRKKLGARKVSFAEAADTTAITGMEIGGVTPICLPPDLPVWIDSRIMALESVILGGGDRTSKIVVDPKIFEMTPNAEIVAELAREVPPQCRSANKGSNMSTVPFDTPIALTSPLRAPKQMLAEQEYDGHASIHDDDKAQDLGFPGAPIEGPTHFSQFVPLLYQIWGDEWLQSGCFSSHFQNMVVEGEEVRAFVETPAFGGTLTRVWAEKADGTRVLEGTASIGTEAAPSCLDERRAKLRRPEQLVILEHLSVGQKGISRDRVKMDFEHRMGDMYPFSLEGKLEKITENSPWYTPDTATDNPWGRAIIPLEMVSVLSHHVNGNTGFRVKTPNVGLFADLEIRMIDGPLFVGEDYVLEKEIVDLSESRRTESYWIETRILDANSQALKAIVLLNSAILKDSYPNYAAELAG